MFVSGWLCLCFVSVGCAVFVLVGEKMSVGVGFSLAEQSICEYSLVQNVYPGKGISAG